MIEDGEIGLISLHAFFTLIYALSLWAYVMQMFTDPGKIIQDFGVDRMPSHLLEPLFPEYNAEDYLKAKIQFCKKCQRFKPPRAHHCKICRQCILRYDHHSIIGGNCIGLFNLKFNVQFYLYSALACAILGFSGVFQWVEGKDDWFIYMGSIFPLSLAIGMGLNGVQLLRNCLKNITTYEDIKGGFNIFDTASPLSNAEQVLGKGKIYWFLPIFPKQIHGYVYPVRIRLYGGGSVYILDKYML